MPPGTPGSTGGTAYNYALVTALARRWSVTVAALHAPSNVVPPGASLVRFAERESWLPKSRAFFWRADLKRVLEQVGAPRLMLTSSATNAAALEPCGEARVVAVLQAYEDFGWRVPIGSLRARALGLKRLAATGQMRRSGFLSADGLLINSQYMRSAVEDVFQRAPKATVLYPPQALPVVELPRFTDLAMRRVGFVYRVGKNLEFILELARATPEREFLIFGHPLSVAADMPSNVVLRGWEPDRVSMYQEAATWLMPSLWEEPFGMVAIEALSQGCRVGVSRKGGLPEAVGQIGRVFQNFRVTEWRKWILSRDKNGHEMRLSHVRGFGLDVFDRKACEWAEAMMS